MRPAANGRPHRSVEPEDVSPQPPSEEEDLLCRAFLTSLGCLPIFGVSASKFLERRACQLSLALGRSWAPHTRTLGAANRESTTSDPSTPPSPSGRLGRPLLALRLAVRPPPCQTDHQALAGRGGKQIRETSPASSYLCARCAHLFMTFNILTTPLTLLPNSSISTQDSTQSPEVLFRFPLHYELYLAWNTTLHGISTAYLFT